MDRSSSFLVCMAFALLMACSGGSDPGELRVVGGTVAGLEGMGLTLQLLETGEALTVPAAATTFQFRGLLVAGSRFHVSIAKQPTVPSQACSIESGASGSAGSTSVAVVCSTEHYPVGGMISGISADGLVLRLNGAQDLPISASGSFTFPAELASGSDFAVTVASAPAAQTCSVQNGEGVVGAAPITDVIVVCATRAFSVGGTVSGLGGSGLVLDLDGERLAIAANGVFVFPTLVADGAQYVVRVVAMPGPQSCVVDKGTGIVADGAVSDVAVACSNNATNVWAASGSTFLHYDGSTWTPVSSGTTKALSGIWGSGPNDIWAVGAGGTILHSTGGAWAARGTGTTTKDLSAVWGSGANDVWAVGVGGTILHWKGSGWTTESSGTTNDLYAVSGTSAIDAWAVGAGGTILHWDGSRWASRPYESPSTQKLVGVAAVSATEVWIAGTVGGPGDGNVLMRWTGIQWTVPWSAAATCFFSGIWAGREGEVWAVGGFYAGCTIHRRAGTDTFEDIWLGPDITPLTAIWGREEDGVTAELWTVGDQLAHKTAAAEWTVVASSPASAIWGAAP